MIGRELSQYFPARPPAVPTAPRALAVHDLHVASSDPARPEVVRGVSFAVRAGEIVGLAGLPGSGATELLHALFGAGGPVTRGRVWVAENGYIPATPVIAIACGLALLTGDRQATGLVAGLSVEHNVTLAALPRFSPAGLLRPRLERAASERQVAALQVRLASVGQEVAALSGGNQQKVALGKWLETQPRVLLLEEPTRGVDVGAKHEIYELMNRWTAAGLALVMFSSELPELLGLADRILVLHRGEITGEFEAAAATAEKILAAAMGAADAGSPPSPA
jgi:ABC-type sugar transport system ATPase subunit